MRLAEATDIRKVRKRDLAELAAGLGFAESVVGRETRARRFAGTVVVVLVHMSPDRLKSAAGEEVRKAIEVRGELFGGPPWFDELVVEAVRERIGPAAAEPEKTATEEEVRPLAAQIGRRRVVVMVRGEREVDDYYPVADVAELRRKYAQTEDIPVWVDEPGGTVVLGDKAYDVEPRPLRLLVILLLASGQVLTHEELVDAVFGEGEEAYTEQDVYQARYDLCSALLLTRKECDKYIRRVRRRGYGWAGPMTFFLVVGGKGGKCE